MDIVGDYKDYNMPLDVYILDMDWHTKNAWGMILLAIMRSNFLQLGGYSWDLRLFPHPKVRFS